jgi:CheY-like chemotaxis protein
MPPQETVRHPLARTAKLVQARSVLIVEDNEDIVRFYRRQFEQKGCQVRVACNGREALEALAKAKPDVVLLDLKMPEMDGFEVLRTMRAEPALNGVPVVVLSARGNPAEIERALALGARDYLVKSSTTSDKVVETVEALLGEPERPAALIRYRVHLRHNRGDAARLGAAFFSAAGLNCPVCGAGYVLDLTPDFSHSTPTFTARFVCPSCAPAGSGNGGPPDGTHSDH